MRRVLGLTLTGLGAFFIVLGLLLRFYLPGQVIKFPLNEYVVTTLDRPQHHLLQPEAGEGADRGRREGHQHGRG